MNIMTPNTPVTKMFWSLNRMFRLRLSARKCCEKLSSNSLIELKSVFSISMMFCGILGLFGGRLVDVPFNILIMAVPVFALLMLFFLGLP